MTNREFNNHLKALRALRGTLAPNPIWKSQTRARLLEYARSTVAAPTPVAELPIRLPRTGFVAQFMFAMRPAMALFMVVGFGAFGWMAGAGAMLGSMPGDRFYGLKTATERAQITFAADETARTFLQLEFVGRRANEVASIAESDAPDRERSVDEAVSQLADEIKGVSDTLDAVRATGSAANATSVAKAVDRKVAELRATLSKTKTLLGSNSKKRVESVETLADDVSVKAVAVLVSLTKQATSDDVASRVKEKIDSAEQKMEVASTEASEEAKAALLAAKKALEENDYAGAVSKVQESNALVAEEADQATVEVTPAPAAGDTNANANANANANTNTNSNVNAPLKAIDQ